MKKGIIFGLLMGMGLLATMAVNLTDTPRQEVGYFDDVVTAKGPVYNVLAYGAKADGATDDATAINAAVQAAKAAKDAGVGYTGTVYFPPGIYVLGSPIVINTNGLKITGHRAMLKPLDNNLEALVDLNSSGSLQLMIDGLIFSGYPVSGSYTGALIRGTTSPLIDSSIVNCWFGMANANKAAIHSRSFHSYIRNCVFEFGGVGILSDSDVVTYTGSLNIVGCTFYEMSSSAIKYTDPGSGNRHGSLIVTNCNIVNQSGGTAGMELATIRDVQISDVKITPNAIGVNPVDLDGIRLTDVTRFSASNVSIIGDVARALNTESRLNYGVYIYGPCEDVSLDNVRVLNARFGLRVRTGESVVRVSNSLFAAGRSDGVVVSADATGTLTLDNCVIEDYRLRCVRTDALNGMDIVIRNSRLTDAGYGYTSGPAYAELAGDGRIELVGNTFAKTDASSVGTPFVTRTATDLHLWNNTFIGAVTAYSGSGGDVNVFNEPVAVKNGSTSAGYVDLYEDSDNGTNRVRIIGPASTDDKAFILPNAYGTTGYAMVDTDGAGTLGWSAIGKDFGFNCVIDGGGSEIADGIKGDIEMPFAGTITSVRLLADQSGSIVVDIWKDTYANYPPTDAVSITSSTPPTITTDIQSEDVTLTNWTKTFSAGDILRFNVDSCTTHTRVTLSIRGTKQ